MAALLGLSTAAPAGAACQALGAGRYHCASTGNPGADGAALRTFIEGRTFPCGSTIILDAGAEYHSILSGGYYYPPVNLKPQAGCSGQQKTQIVSSRLADLPLGRRVSWDERSKMARLVGVGAPTETGLAVSFNEKGVNNYAFRGIAFTTGPGIAGANTTDYLVAFRYEPSDTDSLDSYPRNIEFDRCAFFPYEEERYGPMEKAQEQKAFWRGVSIALNLAGTNLSVHDSLFKGIGGATAWDTAPTITASGATEAEPAVLAAGGIAGSFNLSNHASCATGCTETCAAYGGCVMAAIEGATGEWASLNGVYNLVYNDADSVKVYKGDSYSAYDPSGYDSTGKGELTGTVSLRKIHNRISPVYAVFFSSGQNLEVTNNFIESWGMNVFTGGGGYMPTRHTATVQAGSTSTSIILSHANGLRVGDMLYVAAPGRSVYCTSSAKGCWTGGLRVGKVTAIYGTTVMVTPWGPDGIDVAPATGGLARWHGRNVEGFRLLGNTLFRSDEHMPGGKGYLELKSCLNCLVDGNILTDSAWGLWYLTARNQTGKDPWAVGSQLTFSNNLVGGAKGAPPRLIIAGEDDEHTNTTSENTFFVNNVLPEIRFPNAKTASPFQLYAIFDHGMGIVNGGWLHNTALAMAGASSHRVYAAGGCGDSPAPYGYGHSIRMKDNLASFGDGLQTSACIVNQPGLVKKNLFWADGSASVSTIKSTWAGNEAVADISAELAGACNFANWTNCRLKPDSSFRGTASDGGDPGADIEQVQDHLNGWSRKAGLIDDWNHHRNEAVKAAGTKTVLDFRLIQGGACTVELYVNRNRTVLHGDTQAAGDRMCGRAGNLVDDGRVVFVLGNVAALTPGTEYFYRVTQGAAVMVGSFRTSADAVRSFGLQVSDDAADNLVVEYSRNPDFTESVTTGPVPFAAGRASVRFTAAGGAALYYRWVKRDGLNRRTGTGRTQVAAGG